MSDGHVTMSDEHLVFSRGKLKTTNDIQITEYFLNIFNVIIDTQVYC